jgi:uncharacterized protein with gpF-like domain
MALTGLESAFAALVLAALTRWLAKVARKVMFPWTAWRQVPDPQAALSEQAMWDGEVNRLVTWLRLHAVAGDGRAQNTVVSTSAEVTRHLAAVRNLLTRIPEETFDQIRGEIINGHRDGDETQVIADRIDNLLRATGSENWPNRANVIAVTEVNGASNAGWFAAAQIQQDLAGEPLSKKWVASHDTHVRPTHREADGQTVPLGSPFIVGTWPLLYPGDKNGPADEVINCRCTAVTVEA